MGDTEQSTRRREEQERLLAIAATPIARSPQAPSGAFIATPNTKELTVLPGELVQRVVTESSNPPPAFKRVTIGEAVIEVPTSKCMGRTVLMVDNHEGHPAFHIQSDKFLAVTKDCDMVISNLAFRILGAFPDHEIDRLSEVFTVVAGLVRNMGRSFSRLSEQARQIEEQRLDITNWTIQLLCAVAKIGGVGIAAVGGFSTVKELADAMRMVEVSYLNHMERHETPPAIQAVAGGQSSFPGNLSALVSAGDVTLATLQEAEGLCPDGQSITLGASARDNNKVLAVMRAGNTPFARNMVQAVFREVKKGHDNMHKATFQKWLIADIPEGRSEILGFIIKMFGYTEETIPANFIYLYEEAAEAAAKRGYVHLTLPNKFTKSIVQDLDGAVRASTREAHTLILARTVLAPQIAGSCSAYLRAVSSKEAYTPPVHFLEEAKEGLRSFRLLFSIEAENMRKKRDEEMAVLRGAVQGDSDARMKFVGNKRGRGCGGGSSGGSFHGGQHDTGGGAWSGWGQDDGGWSSHGVAGHSGAWSSDGGSAAEALAPGDTPGEAEGTGGTSGDAGASGRFGKGKGGGKGGKGYKSPNPCRDHIYGRCWRGDACRFTHTDGVGW